MRVLLGGQLVLALLWCGGCAGGSSEGGDPLGDVLPSMAFPVTSPTGGGSTGSALPPAGGLGATAGAAAGGAVAPPPPASGGVGSPATGGTGVATAGTGMLDSGGTSGGTGAPTGGTGGGEPPTGGTGGAMPPPTTGGAQPVVPQLTAECPAFRSGTISFMGLGGIILQAGSKAGSPSAPMVFYWHGTGSLAGEYAGMAGAVHRGVMAEGGVLISFQGTTGGDFSSGTAIFGAGDWNLADQLLACAVRDHNIDARRVFATGCSAGGLFSTAMAATRSAYIAAAAPNSGGWSFPQRFANDHVPALMTIHGAPGVDVVGIDFSRSSATADRDFKAAGGFVINCNHGGFHCGGGGLAGDVWEFFKAHPYGVDPKPWANGLPPGFSSQCKIY